MIEGIAAAALLPLSMSLVIVNYSGAKRALAFGILGGFQATASAVGPIFGGFLTTTLTWRAGFAFEVVIVVLSILHHVRSAKPRPEQTVDWLGTVLSVVGFASIVLGALLAGRHGWFNARRPFKIGGVDFAPLGLSVTFWDDPPGPRCPGRLRAVAEVSGAPGQDSAGPHRIFGNGTS